MTLRKSVKEEIPHTSIFSSSSHPPFSKTQKTTHLRESSSKMADKEATVFVIDLGASMGKKTQGREMTNLDWSMQYVWDKITAKVYAQHDERLRLRYSL